MHVSWRFILALPCGFLLAIVLSLGLLYAQLGRPTVGSSAWTYKLIEKKEEIAAATPGPRLLLVAGSSTLFGINAEMIEKETGVHTINLGTNAGLGLDYIFHLTEKLARPGDIVLLAPEYETYGQEIGADVIDDYTLSYDPDYFRALPWKEKLAMSLRMPIKRMFQGLGIVHGPEERQTTNYHALNSHGDEVGNTIAHREALNPEINFVSPILLHGLASDQTRGFESLRKFIAWSRANHITILATFPNIVHEPEYDRPSTEQAILVITNFYRAQGIPVIGNARETMLDADQFFNSPYHPTAEAAVERTRRLLPEIEPYLPKSK